MPPPRARVERVGLAQAAGDHASDAPASRRARASHASGSMPASRSQCERQIEPAGARVLADVARDVGELHRDAEIAGARHQRRRVAHAHQQRHHRADRAGDARGIVVQLRKRLVAAAFRIPGEAFEQRFGQRARNGVTRARLGEGAIGRRRQRPAVVGARRAARAGAASARDAAAVAIDRIVGEAAEGVERGSRLARRARQEQRRREEGARAASQQRAAGGEIGSRGECRLRRTRMHRATTLSRTRADESTPGSPAPGWVPAPTR